jgi:hypothetical protein
MPYSLSEKRRCIRLMDRLIDESDDVRVVIAALESKVD